LPERSINSIDSALREQPGAGYKLGCLQVGEVAVSRKATVLRLQAVHPIGGERADAEMGTFSELGVDLLKSVTQHQRDGL
jgi:hypothetical protein